MLSMNFCHSVMICLKYQYSHWEKRNQTDRSISSHLYFLLQGPLTKNDLEVYPFWHEHRNRYFRIIITYKPRYYEHSELCHGCRQITAAVEYNSNEMSTKDVPPYCHLWRMLFRLNNEGKICQHWNITKNYFDNCKLLKL